MSTPFGYDAAVAGVAGPNAIRAVGPKTLAITSPARRVVSLGGAFSRPVSIILTLLNLEPTMTSAPASAGALRHGQALGSATHEGGVPEGKDSTVGGDEPVALTVGGGGHAHDRFVQDCSAG
jgi:hypothetical protein